MHTHTHAHRSAARHHLLIIWDAVVVVVWIGVVWLAVAVCVFRVVWRSVIVVVRVAQIRDAVPIGVLRTSDNHPQQQ